MRMLPFRHALPCAILFVGGCKTVTSEQGRLAEGAPTGKYQCPQEVQGLQAAAADVAGSKDAIQQAFKVCLREYLRIDTTNADDRPANEGAAVAFLEQAFKALDIPTRRVEVPDLSHRPGGSTRVNLVASLLPDGVKPGTRMPSILLMHHTDAVAAHPEQWQKVDGTDRPDLSGAISRIQKDKDDEDMMIGRGAVDMKNTGIMQLIAMALYKHQGAPLKKAVHMLAIADEEQNASGAIGILKEIRAGGQLEDLLDAKVALNEGGFGIRGAAGPDSQIQVIGTDERGGAWLRMQNDDPQQLLEDLAALKLIPYQASYVLSARETFWRKWEGWDCKVNRFDTPGAKSNIVPSVVEMEVACRNIPTKADIDWAFNTKELFETFRKLLGKETIMPGLTIGWEPTAWGGKIRIATSSSAHGAAATGMSALDVGIWGLQKLGALDTPDSYKWPKMFDYQYPPSTRATIDALGKLDASVHGVRVPNVDNLSRFIDILPKSLTTNLLYVGGGAVGVEKIFRSSCSWTGMRIPPGRKGVSEAMLDCRLINTRKVAAGDQTHAAEFIAGVENVVRNNVKRGKTATRVILDTGWNYTASPIDGPYFKAVAKALNAVFPKAVIAPFLIPGGTDSTYFRDPTNAQATAFPQGLPSYGFTPAMVPTTVVSGFHGSNERFPISQMHPSVVVYHKIIADIAGTDL